MARHQISSVRERSARRDSTERFAEESSPSNGGGIKGGFRITLRDGDWWWSPGMFTLHGYRPDQIRHIRPTTRLVLAHRHPDDREAMAAAWSHLIADGSLMALHYRILGADGVTRAVFALASTDHRDDRRPTVVTGVLQFEAPA